jgi:xylulokinase
MLLNPQEGRADAPLLARLQLREDQLPELLPATEAAGPLRAEVAEQTRLPAGIPVSAAIHDQYAASTGAGSVDPGDICLGTGTAWVLVANTAQFTPPATGATFVCPHPVGGVFGQMLSMTNGGSALEWALDLTGQPRSRDGLDEALARVPAGAQGLCFWPLLSPGSTAEAALDPGGRMTGIGLNHGSESWLRAVVEGLACELNRHLRLLTHAGLPVTRLVMCGTAAASRVTPQILADVTERPVCCVAEPAVSAYGASVIARALAERRSLADLSRQLAPATKTIEPGPDRSAYQRLMARYLEPFALERC